MILTGESLKFFKLFLENKSFFLSYKNIYESYGLKDEAPEFKDRIYQSMQKRGKTFSVFPLAMFLALWYPINGLTCRETFLLRWWLASELEFHFLFLSFAPPPGRDPIPLPGGGVL